MFSCGKLLSANNSTVLVAVKDQLLMEIELALHAEVCIASEVEHPLEFGCTQPVKKHTHTSYTRIIFIRMEK